MTVYHIFIPFIVLNAEMGTDKELEKIKRRKLDELLGRIRDKTQEKKSSLSVSGKTIDLTDAMFNKFVNENILAVIDVWAPWCGPCRFVSPVVEDIAKDYAGRISFGKLNVDQNRRTAAQYGIMSIPTLLVFKNGELVDKIIGAMPRERLEPMITRHL
jgi:thioredoxin 1